MIVMRMVQGEGKMKHQRSESGQTLVLIIFAIVGLFGFAALAVDLGMVFSERRRAQNAADAAALAMASAASRPGATESTPFEAGMALLAENGYGADNDPNANPGSTLDVEVYHPPISGPYAGDDEYYQVFITEVVAKIFSQFVYDGPEKFTVEAVTRYKGITDLSGGKALYAVGNEVCPGIVFNGGSETYITGGGIYSNSNGENTTGTCASGIATGSSGTIHVTDGDITMAGSWIQNEGLDISPAAVPYQPHVGVPLQDPPDCTGLPTQNDSLEPLEPGYYPGGITIHNGSRQMQPGLYCLGGDFTVNGGALVGNGVVIYMMAGGGGVSLSGNANIHLTTGAEILDARGIDNFTGYLIFMDKDNHNGIDMNGSNGSLFQGTIYAPGYRTPESQEKCNIGGNNTSISLHSSIICHTIGIAGNSNVTIIYDPRQNRRNSV
jgi:hypothetical protein